MHNMKKLLLLMTILVIASAGMAQKSERTNAFMYNKNAQYDKAKEAIDKAIVHPKTVDDAKTWMYRGIIYLNLVFSEDFDSIDDNPLEKSFTSFKEAVKLDPDDDLKRAEEIDPRVEAIGQQYFAYGVDDFNAGDFAEAANKFKKSYDVGLYINKIDTLALLNAALASVRSEQYKQSLDYYEELMELGFNESDVYKNMALAHRNLGDNDAMFATLRAGREKYPDDAGLMLEEINAYLAIGEGAKVVDDLKILVEKDPNNYSIFFVLGTIYGDETSEEMFDMEQAEMYYLKALEINPDYYDAVYNLGALYINESNKLQVEANELPLDATEKYDEMTEEANSIIKKALPLLEKSNELQPGNEETLNVLKSIYVRFNMTDKLESLNE
jgi:tetratricopeptide (TPR) repeat protein